MRNFLAAAGILALLLLAGCAGTGQRAQHAEAIGDSDISALPAGDDSPPSEDLVPPPDDASSLTASDVDVAEGMDYDLISEADVVEPA